MDKKEFLNNHTIIVSELQESDIEQFQSIFTSHVRDRNTQEILWDEIKEIKSYMRGEKDSYGRIRKYLVAKDETGKVWGCMAYATPDPDMVKHFEIEDPEKSTELLNAFVSPEIFKGAGVGKKIFEALCEDVKEKGKDILVIHSGPRYKVSWGFYARMCGENQGMIIEKYGKGGDAMTWKKEL